MTGYEENAWLRHLLKLDMVDNSFKHVELDEGSITVAEDIYRSVGRFKSAATETSIYRNCKEGLSD